jgi:hypothetical protein
MIELGARRSDKDLERSLTHPAKLLCAKLEKPVETRLRIVYSEGIDG